MHHNILLVEDDASIREVVANYLAKDGFRVSYAADGGEAVRAFEEAGYDLILLDLMLPNVNGMDVLRMIRERSHVPILIMSAKDGEADKALGLGFGADDYISKPFSLIELSARIKAAIRRATQYAASGKERNDSVVHVQDLTIDPDNFSVYKNGEPVKLTAKEFNILKLLAANPKRVFTKADIYRAVWNDEYYGDENVINVHMGRLRSKLEDDPAAPKYIKTLWGIGYKLGDG